MGSGSYVVVCFGVARWWLGGFSVVARWWLAFGSVVPSCDAVVVRYMRGCGREAAGRPANPHPLVDRYCYVTLDLGPEVRSLRCAFAADTPSRITSPAAATGPAMPR